MKDFVANADSLTKMKSNCLDATYFHSISLDETMAYDYRRELVRRENHKTQKFLTSLCRGTRSWPIPLSRTIKLDFAYGLKYDEWKHGPVFEYAETFIVDETLWSRVRQWLNDLKV